MLFMASKSAVLSNFRGNRPSNNHRQRQPPLFVVVLLEFLAARERETRVGNVTPGKMIRLSDVLWQGA